MPNVSAQLQRVRSVRRRLKTVTLSPQERFEHRPPSAQTAVDAIPGLWECRFPPPHDEVVAGHREIFDDERVQWTLERIGGLEGRSVVEIGPMEGPHSYMAQRAGAARVVAIESNRESFLKCLVVKELYGLDRCSFLCGDAVEHLERTDEEFDLCIALGVLYHMVEPARLLQLTARRARRLLLWTHVYDEAAMAGTRMAKRFAPPRTVVHDGFRHEVHRHSYGVGTRLAGFLGGTQPYSHWLTREDLFRALDHFGWRDVEVLAETPHPLGPAVTLLATRANG